MTDAELDQALVWVLDSLETVRNKLGENHPAIPSVLRTKEGVMKIITRLRNAGREDWMQLGE